MRIFIELLLVFFFFLLSYYNNLECHKLNISFWRKDKKSKYHKYPLTYVASLTPAHKLNLRCKNPHILISSKEYHIYKFSIPSLLDQQKKKNWLANNRCNNHKICSTFIWLIKTHPRHRYRHQNKQACDGVKTAS